MGKFNTHGGYFAPKNYFKVNEGGSHEENPNGGVQIGVDEQGVPNMLEEGEPVYNDYVYSDNITADEEILKRYNIPVKYAGKLYSQIADAFVDEAEERPLDPISNNGLNAMLVRLADAQEEQKAIKAKEEMEAELASLSPEELAELEQELAAQQQAEEEQAMQAQALEQQQAQQMQMSPEEEQMMAEQQMAQENAPMMQQPMMACGGKLRRYDDGGDIPPTFARDNTRTPLNLDYGYVPDLSNVYTASDRAGRDVISMFPIVGSPAAIENAMEDWDNKKYGSAILEGISAIPVAGTFIKGAKYAIKAPKILRAAKAFSKGKKVMQEAEVAANKVSKLQKAGKDITKAKHISDKLADDAIIATERSKALRDIAAGRKTAKTAAKMPKESTFKSTVHFLERPLPWAALGTYGAKRYVLNHPPYNPYEKGASRSYDTTYNEPDWDFGDMALGGKLNRYPDGGKVDNGDKVDIDPVYVTADKPVMPSLIWPGVESNYWNTQALNRVGSSMRTDMGNSLLLSPEYTYTGNLLPRMSYLGNTPKVYAQNNAAETRLNKALKMEQAKGLADATDSIMQAKESDALPTWGRYAGIAAAGLRGLYNVLQKPDKYSIPHVTPVLPEGQMNLVDPFYNPLDENQVVNDVLASGAGTVRGLMNSGLGVNTPSALLAADYNIGRNIGNARTQIWDANNQRRNQVIAQRNANAQVLGNFNYGINRERAGILNDFAYRNLQNELTRQRLNYAAEQEKANAVNSGIDAIAQGLAGIGRENFAMNQINLNEALDYMLRNGYDVTYKGKKITRNGGTLLRKYKK